MKLPESWKAALHSLSSRPYTRPQEAPTGPHNTPPGLYPSEGPQPSQLPVLAYYLSVVLTLTGIISLGRCTFVPHEEKVELLVLGFSFLCSGLLFLHIANWLYNREFTALISYLRGQVEELRRTSTPVSALDRI